MSPPESTLSTDLNNYKQRVSVVMLSDRQSLYDQIRNLENLAEENRNFEKLERVVSASETRALQRKQRFNESVVVSSLPIAKKAADIVESIKNNPVTVVAGATGSGKTTQLPKLCLQAGYGVYGSIGHTQPRRLAARSTARRIAEELGTPIGDGVGYKVRFSDQTSDLCQVKLLTDGMLLQETHQQRDLLEYDCLIIDEAHERSLNIDFLLGLLKRLIERRPELRIVITSATINPHSFAEFFDDAPIIEVSGRSYPIEVVYQQADEDTDLGRQICSAVDYLWQDEKKGNVLAFLPGEREIQEATRVLQARFQQTVEVLPLYARLSDEQQSRVFKKGDRPRVILATNVAETSLTVPDIHYVVDSGLARISRYHYKSKLQKLAIEKISQASATQRAGRCGRVAPGRCVRLYTLTDFEQRSAFTDPEVLRTNLASVILRMAVLGLGALKKFPFLEPPDRRFIKDGLRLLQQLQIFDDQAHVTNLGQRVARFPLDPRLGAIMVAAAEHGALKEIQVIISGLSAGDPRVRPTGMSEQADNQHKQLANKDSDFMSLLNIWNGWSELERGFKAQREWCKKHYLSLQRMHEWHDILIQLESLSKDQSMVVNTRPASATQIHVSILRGFLDNIGERDSGNQYNGARNRTFKIFPGSALSAKPPKWVVAAEIVHTSQTWARSVAKISPSWVEVAGKHLLKVNCVDEFWSTERGSPMGVEEVSLFGLILNRNRRVPLARYSSVEARKRFIRNALVGNAWTHNEDFVDYNERLRRQVAKAEAKLRRIVTDADKQYDFFDRKIPAEVVDQQTFLKWWQEAEKHGEQELRLALPHVGLEKLPSKTWFPDIMNVAGQAVRLSYVFDAREERDGASLEIPAALLSHLKPAQVEWLIPGWLSQKVEHMLRALPKVNRRHVAPINNSVRQFVLWAVDQELPGSAESLSHALSRFFSETKNLRINESTFSSIRLPPWLSLGMAVLKDNGEEWTWGRNLNNIIGNSGSTLSEVNSAPESEWVREDLQEWDFDDLPDAVTAKKGELSVTACPVLVDKHYRVDMELVPTLSDAEELHGDGIIRLVTRNLKAKVSYLRKNLPDINRLGILYIQLGDLDGLFDDILMAALHRLFPDASKIRQQIEYAEILTSSRTEVVPAASELAEMVLEILTQRQELLLELEEHRCAANTATMTQIKDQVDALVYNGFVRATPAKWLNQIPRYLAAARKRLQKVLRAGAEPADAAAIVRHTDRWRLMTHEQRENKIQYQWMIEEWRVSVFAQELGTLIPISEKRIEKYLEQD